MGDEIDLRWSCEIVGAPDGTISAEFNGVAERPFRYNRIGFCLLHGPNVAGRPYRAQTVHGEAVGVLPPLVAPRRYEAGKPCPLFPPYTELVINVDEIVSTHFSFEGDLFEMDDQRNWTDASFKTYSTPQRLGVPHHARQGQRFHQRVTASFVLGEDDGGAHASSDDRIHLRLGDSLPARLPLIGLTSATHGRRLSRNEQALLRDVLPDHLRIDLDLSQVSFGEDLARGVADARARQRPGARHTCLPEPRRRVDRVARRASPARNDCQAGSRVP